MILSAVLLLFLVSLLHGWYVYNATVHSSQVSIGYLIYGRYVIAFALILLISGLALLWLAKGFLVTAVGAAVYFLVLPRVTSRLLVALNLVPLRDGESKPASDIKPKALFQDIRWGMGKNAVAQLFSGKQQMPVEAGYNEIGFFSSSYGMPASFFFYFASGAFGGDKLRRIQIMYLTPAEQWPTDDEIERAYVLIRDELIAQYGAPAITKDATDAPEEFRQSEILVWKLPESILTLSYGLVRDGVPAASCPPLTVAYGDRKRDPFSFPFAR